MISFKARIDGVIISALKVGEMSGLQLIEEAKRRRALPWWRSLYPHLWRLEREGVIVSREETDTTGVRGGRPRYIYRLAPQKPYEYKGHPFMSRRGHYIDGI